MKLFVDISRVDAIRLLTLTCAVDPKWIPFVLTRNSVPFAFNWPYISLAEEPVTLDRMLEVAEGWMKFTISFCAILNELKLITVLSSAVMFNVVASGCSNVAL